MTSKEEDGKTWTLEFRDRLGFGDVRRAHWQDAEGNVLELTDEEAEMHSPKPRDTSLADVDE